MTDAATESGAEVEVWTHAELPGWLRQRHPRTIERLAKAGRLGNVRPVRLATGTVYVAEEVRAYLSAEIKAAERH